MRQYRPTPGAHHRLVSCFQICVSKHSCRTGGWYTTPFVQWMPLHLGFPFEAACFGSAGTSRKYQRASSCIAHKTPSYTCSKSRAGVHHKELLIEHWGYLPILHQAASRQWNGQKHDQKSRFPAKWGRGQSNLDMIPAKEPNQNGLELCGKECGESYCDKTTWLTRLVVLVNKQKK